MSGPILFITGTDTGSGKTVAATWLASLLAGALAASGGHVALVKAFQTGTTDPAAKGDEGIYRRGLGNAVTLRTLRTLPDPLAPSIAARRAGVRLWPSAVAGECMEIADGHEITLVEGAGGLLVSITDEIDMSSMAGALGASLIVVARPGLGTLNHTLLTLEAAESRGLRVELLIVSGYAFASSGGAHVVEAENLRFFREQRPELPLLVLGRADPGAERFVETMSARLAGTSPSFLANVALEVLDVEAEVAQATW